MVNDTNRSRRQRSKHCLMFVIAFMCMPCITGCDIAKVMAAIGQLVAAIAPNTAATGAAAAPGTTAAATGTAAGTTQAGAAAPLATVLDSTRAIGAVIQQR